MKNQLPFVTAAASAQSWVDVLRVYSKMYEALRGIYTPSTLEVVHGIQKMKTSWSLSMMYYTVVKASGAVDNEMAAAALKQYRQLGNVSGMRRVFEEDIEANSRAGAESTLLLASFTGMWEKALTIYQSNPNFSRKASLKKSLIKSLCKNNLWELSLKLLFDGKELSPALVRPIVKNLSTLQEHQEAIRLVSSTLAEGHSLDTELFAAVLRSLKATGHWISALKTADALRLFVPDVVANSYHFTLYNGLLDCLYESSFYYPNTIESVVSDISSRMNPKYFTFRTRASNQQFRLPSYPEAQHRHFRLVQALNAVYTKLIRVPAFHKRGLNVIVDEIFEKGSLGMVLDTNFLMQCVSKNLSMEHFLPRMKSQNPSLRPLESTTIVVPFTTIQETYHLIWDPYSRVRHNVKLLMWSRVLAFLQSPGVFCLSFSAEYPSSSLSILSHMAYSKLNATVSTDLNGNPDCRILNVCLTLQHYIRGKEAAKLQGTTPAEGILLFSFLKYHVRLYQNTVKGATTNRLILCTLDKGLSSAASLAGVLCFPRLVK